MDFCMILKQNHKMVSMPEILYARLDIQLELIQEMSFIQLEKLVSGSKILLQD